MGGKSCFFIGHRETSEAIYPALYAVVEQHILEYGVTEFIVGHYGGFDRLAASAVKEAKRFYPEVKLTLLLSYHPAERPIPTPDGFDGTFYPPGMESVPRKIAIVRANRYVVDHVDYLIAFLPKEISMSLWMNATVPNPASSTKRWKPFCRMPPLSVSQVLH